MRRKRQFNLAFVFLLVLTHAAAAADAILTEGSGFGIDVSPVDGRIAMDLQGSIWILPANGGQAKLAIESMSSVARPRWSPDGGEILFQADSAEGSGLSIFDAESSKTRRISGNHHDQQGSWHPGGERIVYASDRNDSGLDLWETDLQTGLSWRISDHPGDETEPVWSANGRHLAYIKNHENQYALVLRRHGEPETELVVSSEHLSSPSWRPDGSLLTYLHRDDDGMSLEMAILSEPVLLRSLATGEEFHAGSVSWRDRTNLLYTADGGIRTREFDDRRSRPVLFRAVVTQAEPVPRERTIAKRDLDVIDPPQGRLVIRGARLFDGIWSRYRERVDVLIEAGRIAAVETRRDWEDATVLDLGNVTIMPGLVDAWSAMPAAASGPEILAYGVTTIVSDDVPIGFDPAGWESEGTPGPRVLPAASVLSGPDVSVEPSWFLVRIAADTTPPDNARTIVQTWRDLGVPIIADNWRTGTTIGADLILGVETQRGATTDLMTMISALADAGTPGITALLDSRQARELGQRSAPQRRLASAPELTTSTAPVIVGSKANGLAPGLALHAELRALEAAGLPGEKVLHAAGRNPAIVLGLENQVGTITPGALADMLLVSGDPLHAAADALKIVAVVRNGRFFSLVSLLERAAEARGVE